MKILQHGVILFVEQYERCVHFYRDALSLPIAYAKESLTCFSLGSGYLMVEKGGTSSSIEKSRAQNPTVLRFEVFDVHLAARELEGHGVPVQVSSFEWGEIGAFIDPDGNRCEFKNAS